VQLPHYTVDAVDPRHAALIVVDMQNDFVAVGAPFETPAGRAIVPRLRQAIAFCRSRGIPVIYTAHVHSRDGSDMGLFELNESIAAGVALREGQPGVEIYPEIAPEPGELVIKKHRFSAFYGTDLELHLRGLAVEVVVVSGVTTENCCHATARDAMFHFPAPNSRCQHSARHSSRGVQEFVTWRVRYSGSSGLRCARPQHLRRRSPWLS
jgi:nicotinamidase-related amidase